ncbi:CCAAT displacement protein [Fasciola hepatica]|uniref:Protein CASP n=1 Tax=Fasciola hepatica TaxID=6192 RepID=A0A4E0RUI4_FASHE|nr:CCAAT displacement protein [Fasciola hepatica]
MLSVISSTHATWQELNFADLQKILESTVVDLALNRERGETSRNELVQQTKEFRKTATEEVRKTVLSLLKAFQMEVDASRKRCQFAEEAYIMIYKKLMDLPDPTMALAEVQSIQKRANKVIELEAELRRLKESNDQLKTDANSLRPLEQENKRLQKLIAEMTDDAGSRLESETDRVREESNRILMEKENALIILRAETADKLSVMEEKCMSLTKALELAQSEVFKLKLQQNKSDVGRSSEVELLVDELDKAHMKIKDLEEVLGTPGLRSTSASSFTETDERIRQLSSRVEELESDLADKDNENNILTSTVQKLRTEHEQRMNVAEHKITNLEQSLATVSLQLTEAQRQLTEQSDYSEIASELALLRSIEFPDDYSEPLREGRKQLSDSSTSSNGGNGKKPPLEMLLMNKNRQLQNQIAELNATKDRMTNELDQLRLYETESRQQAQEQSELIRLLESDLYRLQMALNESSHMTTMKPNVVNPVQQLRSTVGVTPEACDHNNRREYQMLVEAIGEQQDDENCPDNQEEPIRLNTNGSGANVLDASLLQIVQHQRDRFRARAEELEQTEASVRQHLTAVQRELELVRADNVKLYEKIRFLQSYSSPIGSRSELHPSNTVSKPSDDRVTVHLGSDPTVLKYSQAYEAHMDPFNQFSRQEKQRVYQDLKPYEKIMLGLGRLVLGNRRARLLAFSYALVIHILIFLALYNAANFQKSADEAESSCILRYAEHMRAAHPDAVNIHRL